jgi:hypothetical protein
MLLLHSVGSCQLSFEDIAWFHRSLYMQSDKNVEIERRKKKALENEKIKKTRSQK